MVEAPDLPKTLEELEKEITCSVCLGHYREPKILPCFHYYCTECLQRLAARVGQPVLCPECRKEATFPQEDARQLPTPFFVNRMIDLYGKMEKAEGKKEADCEMCSGGKAEAFCRQCTAFICEKCVESHQRMKMFASHETVSMEQLRGGGARQLSAQEPPPMKCKEHNEVLKLFCFTCNHLICRDCVIDSHADHKREFVKKCAPQCHEKLRESLAPLQQVQAEITAAVSTIQTAKREVAENHAAVSDTINQSIDQLIAILQQRKKDLLAKASLLAEEKLGALNAQEKSLNMSLAEAQSMVDFVEKSLKNATDEELLEMQQQIVTGVEESCKKQWQVAMDLQPAAKANIITDMSCDQQALCTVGSVGLDPIDLTKSKVGGIIEEVVINKPAQFTLHLVDSTGHSYIDLPSIVAEVISRVDGSVVPAAITPVHNGTYSATYTPQVRGRHYITVRVNGRETNGSPFSVFVRIPLAQLQKPVRRIYGVQLPLGIAISNNDEVLVVEYKGARVSVFDKQGRKLQTIQHKGLSYPYGVTTDPNGNIYVCGDKCIVRFNKLGHVLKVGKSDCVLYLMRVINGMLFACDGTNDRVIVYDCNTLQLIISFGKFGEGNGEFNGLRDILSVNGELYVSDHINCRIQVFDQEGLNFVRSFPVKNPSTQELCTPYGICVGPDGLLYVACYYSCRVLVFTLRGEFVTSLGEVKNPKGIAMDNDGFVYVCGSGVISIF